MCRDAISVSNLNLGVMYRDGLGVKANYITAKEYFEEAGTDIAGMSDDDILLISPTILEPILKLKSEILSETAKPKNVLKLVDEIKSQLMFTKSFSQKIKSIEEYALTIEFTAASMETYTIDVEYDNKTVTAQTTIPAPVFFDSIKVQQSPYVDSIIHLTGYVTDTDPSRENYYVLFYRYRGDKQYQNCFLGLFSDQNADENHSISMPIYRNVSTSTLKLSDSDNKKGRYFKPWDKIDIKLATVDSIGYKFWSEFSALTMTSSIAFMPIYTNVYTNVEGGKGYWIGYGAKVYPLTLRRDTTIRYPH